MREFLENIKEKIGKEIGINLKNRFRYSGKLISVNEEFLVIKDWKIGEIMIEINSLSSIVTKQ